MKGKLLKIALFVALANMAMANEELAKVDLGKSYITVSKYETSVRELAKNVYVLEREDIQNSNARNLVEVLETVPSIFVGSGTINSGVVDFRGQGETSNNNVLILINGIPQNPIDMSGVDFSLIDINSIERIEIIPSGGVIYGDKAVGGVINIITNKEVRSINVETASYGYKNYAFSYGNTFNKLSLYTNFSKTEEDGYREHSEYEKEAFNIGTKYELNERNFLSFDYAYNQRDDQYPGYLTKAQLDNNRKDSLSGQGQGESYTRQNSYALKYEYLGDTWQVENILAYRDKYNDVLWKDFSYKELKETENLVNNFKIKYITEKNMLITGIDFSQGQSESNGTNKIEKEQVGLFLHNTYSISEELAFNLGYRQEEVELKYQGGENRKYSENLIATGLNYRYSNTGTLYMSYEENYRTPATDEYLYGDKDNFKPQLSKVIELGLREYAVNTYFDLALFSSKTENEIFYNPSSWSNENYKDDVLRKGIEIGTSTSLGNFTINQAYTYLSAEFQGGEYEGKTVPWVPRERYRLRTSYNINNIVLIGEYAYTSSVYSISDWSNVQGSISSYSVFNFGTTYTYGDIKVYGGVKNLFNEKYNEYSVYSKNKGYKVYYPAKERNYYLGLKYEF